MTETDEERRALREATRRYLASTVDGSTTATILESSVFSRDGWLAMATSLGLQGMAIGEDLGGSELGTPECLIVHEEMGRALYVGPFLATVGQVVPGLLALPETPLARELLERVAAGSLTAAAAVPWDAPPPPRVDEVRPFSNAGAVTVRADAGLDGTRLTGTVELVVDATLADGLLVAALAVDGLSIYWVDGAAVGITIGPLETVDLTRAMATVTFEATLAELLAGPEGADAVLAAVVRGGMLALAAECVGVADKMLELTVGYVKSRVQFGRPIGSFQAVKHRCAEMLVRLEAARSALLLGASPTDSSHEAAARLCACRIYCGEASFWIANEAIHLHGGIGFTWEYPAHLYFRRAKSDEQLLGSPSQRSVLAAAVAALYNEQEAAS